MEADYLLAAYKIAMFTFYLGVLLYALPIPWPPLKRWAPRLLADSILAAGLSIAFYSLLEASDYIARLLGGSWPLFYTWYRESLGSLLSMKAFIFIVESITGQLPFGDAVRVVLRPLDRVVDVGLFVAGWIGAITYIVQDFGKALAAIGVALISVPFRISRGAGAWLLSFILVFNVGLQVMPSFLSSIAEQPGGPDPSGLEEMGLAFAQVRVEGYQAGIGGGILYLKAGDSDITANYTVVAGKAYDTDYGMNIPVPSRVPAYYTLEVDGVRVNLKPYPARPEDYSSHDGLWSIVLRTTYMEWLGDYAIAYTNSSITGLTGGNDTKTITLNMEKGEYLAIRYPSSCSVNITHTGVMTVNEGSWEWRGISGREYRLTAAADGDYNVTVNMEDCGRVRPSLGRTIDYLEVAGGISAFADANLLASILLYYATVPMIYVFTLFSITFGLSRALGGRDRIPVRI